MKTLFREFFALLLTTLLLSLAVNALAQEEHNRELEKELDRNMKKANSYYNKRLFNYALVLYKDIEKERPQDAVLLYKIGICYLKTTEVKKALPYFRKAAAESGKEVEFVDLDYYMARAYHLQHDFENAITYYKSFKAILNPAHAEEAMEIKNIDRFIENCENGLALEKYPVKARIKHLSITVNSSYTDFLPVVSPDGNALYFASRRQNATEGNYEKTYYEYNEDIFVSYFRDGKWTSARHLQENLKHRLHEAPLGISVDGKKLILYKSDEGHDYDLYYTTHTDSTWSAPQPMGAGINSADLETGGCLSPDGRTFYFCSDRDGGMGGMDIYYTQLGSDGKWGPAVNMGPKVNSPYNEEAPFITTDGQKLYFSSEGHNSIGGFDLFYVTLENAPHQWSQAKNLGLPVNTANDEMSITFAGNGDAFYAAKHEDSYGDEDIYHIHFLPEQENPEQPELDSLIYTASLAGGSPASNKEGYSRTSAGAKMLDQRIYFHFNEAKTLSDDSRKKLLEVASLMKANPQMKLEIIGHSDHMGPIEVNKRYSEERAATAYNFLVEQGVDKNRLTRVGMGNKYVLFKSNSKAENRRNRRVEFRIVTELAQGQ